MPANRLTWSNRRRASVFGALLVALLFAAAWPAGARPVAAATAEISEGTAITSATKRIYAVQKGARNVAAEGSGKIWYTAPDADGIGLVTVISDPDAAVVRYRVEFYGLGEGSRPYDLDIANGFIWFTLRGQDALGRLELATREIQLYTLPAGSAPTGIDVAPNGQIWIAATNGRLVQFDPATETSSEHIFPDDLFANPYVEEIVYQDSRTIWFTMPDANRVVVFNSVTDRFIEIPTGDPNPMGLTIDGLGRPWVTAAGSGRVGVYSPGTLTRWEYFGSSSPGSMPAGIVTFNRAGVLEVWYVENGTGYVNRLGLVQGFTVVIRNALPAAAPSGKPWGVTVAPNEHVWLADTANNVLYELISPYFYAAYFPMTLR